MNIVVKSTVLYIGMSLSVIACHRPLGSDFRVCDDVSKAEQKDLSP